MSETPRFPYDIVQEQYGPIVPVGWFVEHTRDSVHPHVVTNSDQWYVFDGPDTPIALALVEDSDKPTTQMHRIGVVDDHRREGVAANLVGALLDQYGELEAMCQEPSPANEFFADTGWSRVGVVESEPENLVRWTVQAMEYDYDLDTDQ